MEWDYIIVGAGSAGCVIARRLAEDRNNTVLLLDAGVRDWSPAIHVPAGIIFGRNQYDWAYTGEPDASRGGIRDTWSAGSTFGGSSSINGMMYVRGNPLDYDGWADEGCEGWDYDGVLPFFKRMEKWEGGETDYRGGAGPVHVVMDPTGHPLTKLFIGAARDAGFDYNEDYNAGQQTGISLVQANQARGLRQTSARAYLGWFKYYPNLKVQHQSRVTRINFSGCRATGVSFERPGKSINAYCRKEIIISAGALMSPALLLHSGIGDKHELDNLNIRPVNHRPGVGKNFQEHVVTAMSYEVNQPTLNTDKIFSFRSLGHGLKYLFQQKGPLAACVGSAQIFCASNSGISRPDLQIIFLPMGYDLQGAENTVELKMHPKPHVTAAITSLTTNHRGTISLRSGNPADLPRIDFQLLGDEHNFQRLQAGARIIRKIFQHPSLQKLIVNETLPGKLLDIDNKTVWKNYLKQASFRGDHPCGSCKMGAKDDPMAVVDPRLRVIGVEGLRVADASVIPVIPSGNTNAPVMMIGERAAYFITNNE